MSAKIIKRRNHEVQRSYLEQWLSLDGPKALWYVDLTPLQKHQEISIQKEIANLKQNGSYRCKANFAIEDYLYVPEKKDGRDDSLEDDFAVLEAEMIALCRAAKDGEFHSSKPDAVKKAIIGCLSHCIRDAYGWKRILQTHGANPTDPLMKAKDFPPVAHTWLVENTKRSIYSYEKRASSLTWTIFWNLPVSLLTSDRPGWDFATAHGRGSTEIFMPLGPNVMLMGVEPYGIFKAGELGMIDASHLNASTFDKLNVMTVERARGWIVARSKQQLQDLLPKFTEKEYQYRVSTEKLVMFNPASGKQFL